MRIDGPERILQALPLLTARFAPLTGRAENLRLYEFWPTGLTAPSADGSKGCKG